MSDSLDLENIYAPLIEQVDYEPMNALSSWRDSIEPKLSNRPVELRAHAQWLAKLRRLALASAGKQDEALQVRELADYLISGLRRRVDASRDHILERAVLSGIKAGASDLAAAEAAELDWSTIKSVAELERQWATFSGALRQSTTLRDTTAFEKALLAAEGRFRTLNGSEQDHTPMAAAFAASRLWLAASVGDLPTMKSTYADWLKYTEGMPISDVERLQIGRHYIRGLSAALSSRPGLLAEVRTQAQRFIEGRRPSGDGAVRTARLVAGIRRDLAYSCLSERPVSDETVRRIEDQIVAIDGLWKSTNDDDVALQSLKARRDRVQAIAVLDSGSGQISQNIDHAISEALSFAEPFQGAKFTVETFQCKLIRLDRASDVSPPDVFWDGYNAILTEIGPYKGLYDFDILRFKAKSVAVYASCRYAAFGYGRIDRVEELLVDFQLDAFGYRSEKDVKYWLEMASENLRKIKDIQRNVISINTLTLGHTSPLADYQ